MRITSDQRVYEPSEDITHVRAAPITGMATLCGMASDAYAGDIRLHQLQYDTTQPVNCHACLEVIEHVRKIINADRR